MIQRRKFRTKEARKRERKRLIIKTGVGTLLFALFLGGLFYVSNIAALRLTKIHIVTTGVTHEDAIASVIDSVLDDAFLGILPNDSIVVPHESIIKESIRTAFPRVRSVQVNRLGLHELRVGVEERVTTALWCGDVVPPVRDLPDDTGESIHSKGACYVMDATGYIFSKAPTYGTASYPRYYGSLEHAEPVGQFFIDSARFAQWQAFYHSVTYDGIVPVALLFADEKDAELYLSNGVKVLIPRQQDLKNTESKLVSVLAGNTIEEDRTVRYIDLRFGNKAFIKYTEED